MKTTYHFVPNLWDHIAPSTEASDPSPNIQGRAVFADSRTKVLLLPFRAGQILAEHTTPHDAILHVLQGKGEVTLGEDRRPVQAGSWIRMEGGLPHSIHAETDLLLLLQVLLDPSDVPLPAGSSA